jgi:hypothetical protein
MLATSALCDSSLNNKLIRRAAVQRNPAPIVFSGRAEFGQLLRLGGADDRDVHGTTTGREVESRTSNTRARLIVNYRL